MISEKEIDAGARALVRYALGTFEIQEKDKNGEWIKPPFTPNIRARQAALDVLQAAERARLEIV